jgi:hypothetical protein
MQARIVIRFRPPTSMNRAITMSGGPIHRGVDFIAFIIQIGCYQVDDTLLIVDDEDFGCCHSINPGLLLPFYTWLYG